MGRSMLAMALAITVGWSPAAMAGPVSAGQGMGPLGPRSQDCQPGTEAADRDGCRSFRSGDVSRQRDIRCTEMPTRQGLLRVCRD